MKTPRRNRSALSLDDVEPIASPHPPRPSLLLPVEDDTSSAAAFDTPAFNAALPGISPGGLLEALEDPAVIQKIARGDLYLVLGRLRKDSRAFAPPQLLQYAGLLAKIADVIKPEAAPPTAANLPQFVFNMPQYPADFKPKVPEQFLARSVVPALTVDNDG